MIVICAIEITILIVMIAALLFDAFGGNQR